MFKCFWVLWLCSWLNYFSSLESICVSAFIQLIGLAQVIIAVDTSSWYIPAIITSCAVGALVSITLGVMSNIRHALVIDLSSKQEKLEMGISIGFSATADLVTTVTLCWRLHRNGTGVKRIQTLLHHLHLYFITRGLFVTLTEVARVILYEMQAVSLHWLPLQFVSCKLYVNTMLAILNARTSLRIQMDADAMDASKCMPPICFEDCRANQPDVEAHSLIIMD